MDKNKHIFNISWKACFRICASLFLLFLAVTYWAPLENLAISLISAAQPVFIGIVMAYIVNILMSLYERHFFPKSENRIILKIKRPVCLFLSIVTVLGIIVLVIMIVVPQIIDALAVITSNIPAVFKKISSNKEIMAYLPEGIADSIKNLNVKKLIEQIIGFLEGGIGGKAASETFLSTISLFSSKAVSVLLGFTFALYILSGKEELKRQFGRFFKAYTGKKFNKKLAYVMKVADESFHAYIVGQVTEAVIIGVLCALGMKLFKFPYATMIGAVVGFTALIPVLGAYIGGIVGALMIAAVSPLKVIPFAIYLFALQELEGNFIYPKVVGTSLGLPGIWVMVAVTVGGSVGGMMGMLFAVPIFTTLYKLVGNYVRKNEAEEGESATDKFLDKMNE